MGQTVETMLSTGCEGLIDFPRIQLWMLNGVKVCRTCSAHWCIFAPRAAAVLRSLGLFQASAQRAALHRNRLSSSRCSAGSRNKGALVGKNHCTNMEHVSSFRNFARSEGPGLSIGRAIPANYISLAKTQVHAVVRATFRNSLDVSPASTVLNSTARPQAHEALMSFLSLSYFEHFSSPCICLWECRIQKPQDGLAAPIA